MLAYMLCSGRAPFKGRSDDEIVTSVRRGKYTLSSKYWDGVSELAKNFVRKCLQYYPSRRPAAGDLLSDPWMLAVRKAGFGPDGGPRRLHEDVLASLRDFSRFPPLKVRPRLRCAHLCHDTNAMTPRLRCAHHASAALTAGPSGLEAVLQRS